MKTYALLCAYNEEKTANDVIRTTLKYVDKVIFVNDGSEDRTLEKVQKRFGKNKKVIIISYVKNRGKGHALITGFKRFMKERGDIIVTLDVDGQHNPKEIPVVMSLVKNGYADVVIGTRYKRRHSQPGKRTLFNISSTLVLLASSGGFFTDISSGFRCYSKTAVRAILPSLKMEGFGIEPEILHNAKKKNLRIAEVPINCSYKNDDKRNFSKIADGYFKFALEYKGEIFRISNPYR